MSEITVKPFTLEDIETYSELRIEMVRNHPEAFDVNLESLLVRKKSDWVNDAVNSLADPRQDRFLARWNDDYPVGTVGLLAQNDTLDIGGLYVRAAYRARHVGSLLLSTGIEYARSNGFSKAALWVSSANPNARKWYENMLFAPTDPPTEKYWWDGSSLSEEYLERQV